MSEFHPFFINVRTSLLDLFYTQSACAFKNPVALLSTSRTACTDRWILRVYVGCKDEVVIGSLL